MMMVRSVDHIIRHSSRFLLSVSAIVGVLGNAEPVFAQTWLKVTSGQATTLYIDPASVVRTNSIVKVTELADFKTDRSDRSGFSYRSQVTQYEINCDKHVRRMLSQTTYLGAFGMGKEMSSLKYVGAWTAATPSSIGEVLDREVCAAGN